MTASMSTRDQMRALARLMRGEWRAYAIGGAMVAVGIVTALAYPYVIRLIVDNGLQTRDAARIDRLAWLMLGLLAAEGAATLARSYLFNVAAERVTAALRERTFAHLLDQEIAFFDARTTGEITARLSADIPHLQRVLGDDLADGLRFALWGVGGTALLFYTSPMLSLIVLVALPPMVLAAGVLGTHVKRHAADAQHAYSATGAVTEESIAGIRTVRAFSQEGAEAARHASRVQAAVQIAKRRILATSSGVALSFIIGETGALIALWVGGHMIVDGRLSSGALFSFILYALMVARGFKNASEFWGDALRAFGATEWIFALLARAPAMPLTGGERPLRVAGGLTFERVHFTYETRPDVEALTGVDLAIEPGDVVAFVGRSGSGKSTLLSLLLRFYDPTAGRVRLDGRDIRQIDPAWLRGQMGIVLQEPVLFSRSIADNIRYSRPDATDEEVRRAAAISHADEFIARLPNGLETSIGDRGVQLSGGQRQRLAIARAIIRRPPILLLDEATSALDAESESLVQEALRVLDYRPTTIIVAHRLSTVVNVDRVVVLEKGRIVATGTHQALLQSCDLYRQLVETQLVAA